MIRTRVGYAGGTAKNPTYHSIADHTETLQVDYDPSLISYEDLLEVFWNGHDPTRRAWSRQYMAAVFYHSEEQRRLAEATRDRRARESGAKIGTEILPLGEFTVAEDYHQKYYLRLHRDIFREFRAMYPAETNLADSTAAARVNGYLAGYGTRRQAEAEIEGLGLSLAGRAAVLERVQRQ